MSLRRALGLMSGTSLDGVDVALIETDGESIVHQGPSTSIAYSAADKELLRRALGDAAELLVNRTSRPGALATAEALVTQRHAFLIERFLARHQISPDQIDIVGFHGQTVLHRPETGLTVQIGDGDLLARRCGIAVACDFRAADVAAGGQGAPLVPVYHRALVKAAGFSSTVGVVNIGGVANITVVAPGGEPLAWDTGPGNALIDDLMFSRTGASLDKDGAAALGGKVDDAALAALMAHPFFAVKPPKSLDRNAFSRSAVGNLTTGDAAATLAAFTAQSIADSLKFAPSKPAVLVVCGGGAHNPVIMRELARRSNIPVNGAATFGWSIDAMEAQAFGYLAVRALDGSPITFPSTTGAPRPLTGGVIHLP